MSQTQGTRGETFAVTFVEVLVARHILLKVTCIVSLSFVLFLSLAFPQRHERSHPLSLFSLHNVDACVLKEP